MAPEELSAYIARVLSAPRASHLDDLLSGADEWAVSAEMAHLLTGLVGKLKPQSILEFGAGRSSLVLAAAMEGTGGGRLTSVEHQPVYAEAAWSRIGQYRAVDAELVAAKLALRLSSQGLLHEYVGIRRTLRRRGPFGFVFVDAPPGHLGRDATLFEAGPCLTRDAVVVLDDAARPSEQTAIRRWERAFDLDRVFESATYARGVAVLRLRGRTTARVSPRTFLGSLHDRLRERRPIASTG